MQIEEQIKKLQRIKAKIDLYRRLLGNVQDELTSVNQGQEHKALEAEYPGLLAEFCAEVTNFCSGRVGELGLGPTELPQRLATPQEHAPPQRTAQAPAGEAVFDEEPRDPLKFLLKYRSLEGKRVTWQTKDGPVEGTVRGMVTPNITVETDTGFVLPVPPKELKVIETSNKA